MGGVGLIGVVTAIAALLTGGPVRMRGQRNPITPSDRKEHEPIPRPLTADNTAVLLVDHQIGLFTGVRDLTVAEPKHNVSGLAKAALRLGLPTVVTTTAADSTVVVGHGQHVDREVDVVACERDGVPVLRRASGGGTVFHDLGNLNITTVLPGEVEPLKSLGPLMADAVGRLGLDARVGDRGLFVGGLKLCGFAAFRSREGVLAHSTLLVTTDSRAVGAYLTPQPTRARPLDSHRSPAASLADHGVTVELTPGHRRRPGRHGRDVRLRLTPPAHRGRAGVAGETPRVAI